MIESSDEKGCASPAEGEVTTGETIRRFRILEDGPGLERADNGPWVWYSDHCASIESLARELDRLRDDQDVMLADLAALLRALGMHDGARAESPHAVMQSAIANVASLRADAERYRYFRDEANATLWRAAQLAGDGEMDTLIDAARQSAQAASQPKGE